MRRRGGVEVTTTMVVEVLKDVVEVSRVLVVWISFKQVIQGEIRVRRYRLRLELLSLR